MITTTVALRLWLELTTMTVNSADVRAMADVKGTSVPACAILLVGHENDVLFAESCDAIKVKLNLK